MAVDQRCTRLNIPFAVAAAKGIENRDDAKEWIIRNQFGRRNLSSFIRTELALKLEAIFAKRAKENLSETGKSVAALTNQGILKSENLDIKPISTMHEVAKLAGVGHDTVAKVKRISEAGSPELIGALRSGEISINVAADIATLPQERQAYVVERGKGEALETAKEIRLAKAAERRAALEEVRKVAPPPPPGPLQKLLERRRHGPIQNWTHPGRAIPFRRD